MLVPRHRTPPLNLRYCLPLAITPPPPFPGLPWEIFPETTHKNPPPLPEKMGTRMRPPYMHSKKHSKRHTSSINSNKHSHQNKGQGRTQDVFTGGALQLDAGRGAVPALKISLSGGGGGGGLRGPTLFFSSSKS